MKYEAVFGNQDLFYGSPRDCVIAIVRPFIEGVRRREVYFFKSVFDAVVKAGSDFNFNDVILRERDFAMRRIIQEPKRWTVADQKAGRLPEVGAELLHESEGYVNFVGEFDFRWMLRTKEGGLYLAEKFYCSPIETPEEKSERLRGEWVELAFDNMMRKEGLHSTECLDRMKIHFSSAYDTLLSGTLSVPTKGGE